MSLLVTMWRGEKHANVWAVDAWFLLKLAVGFDHFKSFLSVSN